MGSTSTQRVAVLGGGPIGAGVVALALLSGAQVALWSRRQETRERAQGEIRRVVLSHVDGAAVGATPEAVLKRLRLCSGMAEAVREAAWVVEAVVEDTNVKHSVLREVEGAMAEDSYLATTASWLPISILAQPLARPERFLGLHFYNPPWGRRAVEVVPGQRTVPETLGAAKVFLRELKQVPAVLGRDGPGFVANRLLFRQFDEAILAVAGGMPPQLVDTAYRHQLDFPFGPCESLDYAGLDSILRLFRLACCWGWNTPAESLAFLEEQTKQGRVGPTSGRGFYVYPNRRWERQPLEREAGTTTSIAALFAPVVLEATRLAHRGIASPQVIEVIARDCIGWRTGPLAIGCRLGLPAIQEALANRYRQEPLDCYRSDASLETVLSFGDR
ncbi:MAG: 3-hydroxyacyl-CoA dehydrogenase NAD-binding domain-containing protein [Dehalococcoidia bacterium]